jgi:hypothetical protein
MGRGCGCAGWGAKVSAGGRQLVTERERLLVALLTEARRYVPTNCGRWEDALGNTGLIATPLAQEIDTALSEVRA